MCFSTSDKCIEASRQNGLGVDSDGQNSTLVESDDHSATAVESDGDHDAVDFDDRRQHAAGTDSPTIELDTVPFEMMDLSARQLVMLRKLSVVRLTSLVEAHSQSDVDALGLVSNGADVLNLVRFKTYWYI